MCQESFSYVMRVWKSERDGDPVWHASLHNPHTDERYTFADLAVLLCFLKRKTEENSWEDHHDMDDGTAHGP
jgi:hypothetical protein